MRKTQASKIADHFGVDISDVKDYEYQPTDYYNVRVYAINNEYWCSKKPPKYYNDELGKFIEVVSSYDKKTKLWVTKENIQ